MSALTGQLNPLIVLVAITAAALIGAFHAVTPGHGKTLMAAYLVGSRGTSSHALGLGLSVAVSHTLGIFVLALLIVGAQGLVAPDLVQRTTPVIAAISIIAIGGWMLLTEIRRRVVTRRMGLARPHGHDHGHVHHDRDHDHDHDPSVAVAAEHDHGGVRHSHLPARGSTLSWRGLFVLGLAGGLIPSASALVILLGSMAAGRPAFHFGYQQSSGRRRVLAGQMNDFPGKTLKALAGPGRLRVCAEQAANQLDLFRRISRNNARLVHNNSPRSTVTAFPPRINRSPARRIFITPPRAEVW